MNSAQKIKAFDYLVNELIIWSKELNHGIFDSSNLSKLKVTKLLFFASAISATPDNKGLLEIFDHFYAMPYGHVESEVHDQMDSSNSYLITKHGLSIKQNFNQNYFSELDLRLLELITDSVRKLKLQNMELVNYSPFELVEISHKWESWRTMFSLAKSKGKHSMRIPNELIQSEIKYFNLEPSINDLH